MTPQEKQQLKARFFGMHIGCKCQYDNMFSKPTINYLVGYDGDMVVLVGENGQYLFDFDRCKLILRPLSSITDEEILEAAKIWHPYSGLDECEIEKWVFENDGYSGRDHDGNEYRFYVTKDDDDPYIIYGGINKHERIGHLWEVFDYLRSLNFCIPFCGLDPVSEGWAILEETTNQPTGANNQ